MLFKQRQACFAHLECCRRYDQAGNSLTGYSFDASLIATVVSQRNKFSQLLFLELFATVIAFSASLVAAMYSRRKEINKNDTAPYCTRRLDATQKRAWQPISRFVRWQETA